MPTNVSTASGMGPTSQHSAMVSIIASGPSCPGLDFPHYRNIFRGKTDNVADVNKWNCIEGSGQWLEKVDRVRLVLVAS